LDALLKVSERKFKFDQLLTKFSVEDRVLLFELGLSENVLNNRILNVLSDSLIIEDLSIVLDLLFESFSRGHHVSEEEFSELAELFIEVVGSNDVEDKSDLLRFVLLHLDFLLNLKCLLLELHSLFSVFTLPLAFTFSKVMLFIWTVALEVTTFAIFVIRALLLHLVVVSVSTALLSLDIFGIFSASKNYTDTVLKRFSFCFLSLAKLQTSDLLHQVQVDRVGPSLLAVFS
jgi:hypothetical protein